MDPDPGGPKHTDPTDLESDPDPQHCFKAFYKVQMLLTRAHHFGIKFSWINQLTPSYFITMKELSSVGSVDLVG